MKDWVAFRARRLVAIAGVMGQVMIIPAVQASASEAAADMTVDCEKIYQRPGHGQTFYEENPTYKDTRDDNAAWVFSTPSEHGLKADVLSEAAEELGKTKRALSALVIKDGTIVLEEYFNGSSRHDSNNIHSASKSIMSVLMGIAIDKGYVKSVDQKLSELLPGYYSPSDSRWKKKLTVRHLLTMSSGMKWTEDDTEWEIQTKTNWVKAISDQPMVRPPGKEYSYNTGLTHLMSAIISETTGQSTCEFAHENLFYPLGITAEHWGRDPQEYYSGGYNLYMTPREMAKFGLLVLQGGRIPSGQLVPGHWVRESMQTYYRPYDDYGYGYNWWIMKVGDQVIPFAWGWGGQMIYIIPKMRSVVVITRDTSDAALVGREPATHDFIRKYVSAGQ
ncbi:serine hydrolase [Emcibacter sp.]|uniref:serine hydrolase domain-containing protein n=1 Tax=Emcibacter sp. TaxID=1979954 RepID=UPI002AA6AD3D|nr:serine hydrolase [Emcibacter sp.]